MTVSMNWLRRICRGQRTENVYQDNNQKGYAVSEQLEKVNRPDVFQALFGNGDENMRRLESLLDVHIELRNGTVVVEGAEAETVDLCNAVISRLYHLVLNKEHVDPSVVSYAVTLAKRKADPLQDTRTA